MDEAIKNIIVTYPLYIAGLIAILILALIYSVYTSWNFKYSLEGTWVGTKSFCDMADISSMLLEIDQGANHGHLVILDGFNILSNQYVTIGNWSLFPKRKPWFTDTIHLSCTENQVMPRIMQSHMGKDGILRFTGDDGVLYAELYKIN